MKWIQNSFASHVVFKCISLCPTEPGYITCFKTVQIQISWLHQKPADFNLHYFHAAHDLFEIIQNASFDFLENR